MFLKSREIPNRNGMCRRTNTSLTSSRATAQDRLTFWRQICQSSYSTLHYTRNTFGYVQQLFWIRQMQTNLLEIEFQDWRHLHYGFSGKDRGCDTRGSELNLRVPLRFGSTKGLQFDWKFSRICSLSKQVEAIPRCLESHAPEADDSLLELAKAKFCL